MLRSLALSAALAFGVAAHAQAPFGSAITVGVAVTPQEVQLIAPQLLGFAGSAGNFEALVLGLAQGTAVTLVTPLAGGLVQIATFTPPAGGLSAAEIARTLEVARTNLIANGIAAPTAQQIAVMLVGGALPTVLGNTPVRGVMNGTSAANAVQVRNEIGTAVQPAALGGGTAANIQAITTGLRQGTAITLTGAGQSLTFTPPGPPMSQLEASQALQLASLLLVSLGVTNPTPDQLRVALLGGTLALSSGPVPVQGVLQGRLSFTSASSIAGTTSASPSVGTSNTSIIGTSNTPAAVAPGAAASPSSATGTTASPAGTASGAFAPAATPGVTPRFGAAGGAR
jgi:hypothetical protein